MGGAGSDDETELPLQGRDTDGLPCADHAAWSDPADLWALGGAHAASPIAADDEQDGERDAMNASLGRVHGGSHLSHLEEGEGDDTFIQDDDGGDDDEFGLDWIKDVGDAGQKRSATSRAHRRPDSASHHRYSDMSAPRPEAPDVDRFPEPILLDPEEARSLRVDSIWPSFVVGYHALVLRKYAVGGNKMLLQYLQRGYPEYCVEAIVNAVHTLLKKRGAGGGGSETVGCAFQRLVVMGNYCAELLRNAREYAHAKAILQKIEPLTSSYAMDFEHKALLRVGAPCATFPHAYMHAYTFLCVNMYLYIHAYTHTHKHTHAGVDAM